MLVFIKSDCTGISYQDDIAESLEGTLLRGTYTGKYKYQLSTEYENYDRRNMGFETNVGRNLIILTEILTRRECNNLH